MPDPRWSGSPGSGSPVGFDPARLEVFKHLYSSVAEEMGVALRRSAYSPNIKERRDYSCAVFDPGGAMIAQAAHIPVHLGSMPLSVAACIGELDLRPGDVAILNDPFRGGTHLPDITVVSPVHSEAGNAGGEGALLGYVASRAHHSDVGGIAPGSLPLATTIGEEGLVIPPVKLLEGGELVADVWERILGGVRTPDERAGDLRAQLAAGTTGQKRLADLASRYGRGAIVRSMAALLAYSERTIRQLISELPDGRFHFEDALDSDGTAPDPPRIAVSVSVLGDELEVDFSASSAQRTSSLNAVFAVTLSAVAYVVRTLTDLDIPANSGCLVPVRVIAPPGSIVNAVYPAAVSAGNVETSQRITDVLLGAFAQACPDRVPAASQGTMNNLTVGGRDPVRNRPFAYYETIGGGCGAAPDRDGTSAIQSHMTNTMNTPVEALEFAHPFRVRRTEIRRGSGGSGRWRGGDGMRRDIEFLSEARVTVISDRRETHPYGLAGGAAGRPGRNVLFRGEAEIPLPGRFSIDVRPGDTLSIRTPGGGGYGEPDARPVRRRGTPAG
jgi:N-methylhydantoinase B